MKILIYGYSIICLICFFKSIYNMYFKKDDEIKSIIENITYTINIALKSNLSINTIKFLLVIFNLALIGILPIFFLISDKKNEI